MPTNWNAAPIDRWVDPTFLDHLRKVRAPWNRLVSRIVQGVASRVIGSSSGPIVEIGAGDGQLRDWLPAEYLSHLTHTEPSSQFLERLRQRFPLARGIQAEANPLPFAAGSVSAILGLCVFDSLPDLASACDEFRRVLQPNGVVVHFLDLATNPDCLFPELIARGEIPLTNFARDPGLLSVLTNEQKALLPSTDDFDEVLAVELVAFTKLKTMLESSGHPLAKELAIYDGFDPFKLAQAYMQVTADASRLAVLNRALLTLTLTAKKMNRDWPLRSISIREHLRAKLMDRFGRAGFEIHHAGPISAWEVDASIPEGAAMLLRHAGQTRSRKELVKLPGMAFEESQGMTANSPTAGPVRAGTIEVFVGRLGV